MALPKKYSKQVCIFLEDYERKMKKLREEEIAEEKDIKSDMQFMSIVKQYKEKREKLYEEAIHNINLLFEAFSEDTESEIELELIS